MDVEEEYVSEFDFENVYFLILLFRLMFPSLKILLKLEILK